MFRRIFRTSEEDYRKKLEKRRQTFEGAEINDETPMAPPVGFRSEPSMVEYIRAMVRSEKLRIEAEQAGQESFEEADDFDVDDDEDPQSPYEFERFFEPHPVATNPPKEEAPAAPVAPDTPPTPAPKASTHT